jgi:hypothetical protein
MNLRSIVIRHSEYDLMYHFGPKILEYDQKKLHLTFSTIRVFNDFTFRDKINQISLQPFTILQEQVFRISNSLFPFIKLASSSFSRVEYKLLPKDLKKKELKRKFNGMRAMTPL